MPTLSSIAEIRMGATLRGRDATRPVPNGTFPFIRIGDITQDGQLRSADLLRIEPNERVPEVLWLRPGDVLFPNRGTRTTAIALGSVEPKTIVGPQFFILRPDPAIATAEYVAWYLRSAESAAHFEGRRKGSYVQIIQRKDLAELQIPLPPIEKQRQIVELARLALQERELSERLSQLRWRHANERLIQAAKSLTKVSQS